MVDPAIDAAVPAAAPGSSRRMATVWPSLWILALTICSAAAMRAVFSPVQEVVKLDLQLSDLQMSLIQGLAASIPIAILAAPLGWVVDHAHRVRILAALAGIWTLGTLATAFAPGFTALFLTRMLAGLGAVCALPVAISIAADLCAPDRRGRALLLLSLGTTVGGALAFALGGALYGALAASHFGLLGLNAWRSLHLMFGAASALLILPLLMLAEPARLEQEAPGAAMGVALRALWRRRGFLAPLFIGQISVVMADTAAGIWAAPVLSRSFGLHPADFAGWMGLTLLGSGVLGGVIGGFTADLGHQSRLRGGILLGAVVASGLSIPAALFPIMPTVPGFAAMLALLLVSGAVTGLVTATAIAVLIPNDIRGVCLGAFIVIGAIVGFGLAPTLVSLCSSGLGGEAHLNQALALTGLATSAASFLAFVAAALRSPARDAGTV